MCELNHFSPLVEQVSWNTVLGTNTLWKGGKKKGGREEKQGKQELIFIVAACQTVCEGLDNIFFSFNAYSNNNLIRAEQSGYYLL